MNNHNTMKYLLILSTLISFLGIACDKDMNQIQNLEKLRLIPTSEAHNFVLKHTDSAKIKSVLEGSLVYDYKSIDFPFTEFPNGITLTLYDKEQHKSVVRADYAIMYDKNGIIDLQKNVTVTSKNGSVLSTEQLYFDQKREWVFTEHDCKLTSQNGTYHFKGFDAKSDLLKFQARQFSGVGNYSE
ncbi:MAG: LPS export ABC transporter periplasmic protein LptC [Bacteroidota bacterium]|nr:LPS export ABC transporter periplasmic protein LptC [Bacteroidota bacterium]